MTDEKTYFTVKHKDNSTVLQFNGDYEVVGFIPTTATRVCVILSRKEEEEGD